ncbi:MAG TPA: hypothetical protein GX707_01370, partial [Epulopiscium sp.]|nr:hypothetical protein [Candidatus Epulonipiscium sp.]
MRDCPPRRFGFSPKSLAHKEQSENKEFQKMDFEDRLSLLIDLEYSRRKSNKLQRLIKSAT